MECRQDVIEIGAEILERELTEEEINELTEAMEGRYNLYCEMYDEDVDIDALFNEDFYDALKENIEEMFEKKEQ